MILPGIVNVQIEFIVLLKISSGSIDFDKRLLCKRKLYHLNSDFQPNEKSIPTQPSIVFGIIAFEMSLFYLSNNTISNLFLI